MKKVIVISIIIVAAIAIFAVVAGQNDMSNPANSGKATVEKVEKVEKKVDLENLNKDAKVPLKTLKMQKLKILDRDKLRENIKKMKKEKDENPDKTLNFPKKRESCGG